jgi:hypothetical protein
MRFFASSKEGHQGLFHDLTARSKGLLVNVRKGGFRKDLSMVLERDANELPTEELYTVNGEDGINFEELGIYYNLYKDLERPRATFTTGGAVPRGSSALVMESSPAACLRDYEHHFKQPTIISYQAVFSLEARQSRERGQMELRLVIDPIITLWNPHDVPLVIPRGSSFLSVKYFGLPYDLEIQTGGRSFRCPLIASLSSSGDSNYLSLTVGLNEPLVFKPGEVVKFSQSGDEEVKSDGFGASRHRLAGYAGFNYGGGVNLPLKTASGETVTVAQTDTITYAARPNNLTAGKEGRSGNVLTSLGFTNHSRHFSMTHHEVYVGYDRGSEN